MESGKLTEQQKDWHIVELETRVELLQKTCIELSKRAKYTKKEKLDYWQFDCECGFSGLSLFVHGGGQIADTGDYGDCYCPCCGRIAD